MKDKVSNTASGGVSFLGLLFIAFLVLKLCGVIDWSWWWVTAPLWGGLAVTISFGLIGLIILLVEWMIHQFKQK